MFKIGYMLKYNRKLHINWNVFKTDCEPEDGLA